MLIEEELWLGTSVLDVGNWLEVDEVGLALVQVPDKRALAYLVGPGHDDRGELVSKPEQAPGSVARATYP